MLTRVPHVAAYARQGGVFLFDIEEWDRLSAAWMNTDDDTVLFFNGRALDGGELVVMLEEIQGIECADQSAVDREFEREQRDKVADM